MKTLTTFNKRQLRNAEHVQLHANVRSVINFVTIAKMGMSQQLMDSYTAAIATEQDIVNRAVASSYTKEMEEMNVMRSRMFSRIHAKLVLCSFEHQNSDAYKARIVVEQNILSKYPAAMVNKLAYQERTAVYAGFVQDCRTFLTSEQLESIRIDSDLDDMVSLNQKFNELYQKRVAEKASVEAELSLKLRAATDELYARIALFLNAMANDIDTENATKAAACASAIDLINVVINDARARLEARVTRNAGSAGNSGSGSGSGSGNGASNGDSGSGSGNSGSGNDAGSGSNSDSGSGNSDIFVPSSPDDVME